jgi:hypothetical protein
MALHFSRTIDELEIWSASEPGFSFVISNESSDGPGLHGQPGFVASWRPININRPAIRVSGSPFKTFAEAAEACEAMLAASASLAPAPRLRLDGPRGEEMSGRSSA